MSLTQGVLCPEILGITDVDNDRIHNEGGATSRVDEEMYRSVGFDENQIFTVLERCQGLAQSIK